MHSSGLLHEPEDGFWDGIDRASFEAENLQANWPENRNKFARAIASNLTEGRCLTSVSTNFLLELVSELTCSDSDRVYLFELCSPSSQAATLQAVYVGSRPLADIPIRADNACIFLTAVAWALERSPKVHITFAAGATFWIERLGS
mgnify:CR=1 FL=1